MNHLSISSAISKPITSLKITSIALLCLLCSACTAIPTNVTPLSQFEVQRYLGKWYEIARLDNSFEKGLTRVTAEYSMRDDGGITVLNQGYSIKDKIWQSAQGKAYFVDTPDIGHLKVSFFGPFYASYIIYQLDNTHYQYAFVTGYNKDYLWLLARTPTVDQQIIQQFIDSAKQRGFDVNKLIMVDQNANEK